MTEAKLMLGLPLAEKLYSSIQNRARILRAQNKPLHIRAILVGEDPSSVTYLKIKGKKCAEVGIDFKLDTFESTISYDDLRNHIHMLNNDPEVTGIVIQLPLPDHLDRDTVLSLVSPTKDIDAFWYTLGQKHDLPHGIRPPTPAGMLALLDEYAIDFAHKTIVVVGNGFLVGKPLIAMLEERALSCNLVDSTTENAAEITREADVLFTGVGHADLITPAMIKEGVVLVDAGYDKVDDQTRGDVSPECIEKASWMTPAIGGVGPLTVACLLDNALSLAELAGES